MCVLAVLIVIECTLLLLHRALTSTTIWYAQRGLRWCAMLRPGAVALQLVLVSIACIYVCSARISVNKCTFSCCVLDMVFLVQVAKRKARVETAPSDLGLLSAAGRTHGVHLCGTYIRREGDCF